MKEKEKLKKNFKKREIVQEHLPQISSGVKF